MAASVDRAAIISAARRMIERDGVEGLSMRKLAVELDSKPMTLYYHVPSKDDLLQAVLTEVAAEIPWQEPTPGLAPRDRMLQVVSDMADRLREVDWIIDALRPGTHVGPPALVLADRFIEAAFEEGATAQQALDAWRSCWYLVASELQWMRSVGRRTDQDSSWYERIDDAALAHVPTVRRLIREWPALSAGFDLRQALAAQVDGAVAGFHR